MSRKKIYTGTCVQTIETNKTFLLFVLKQSISTNMEFFQHMHQFHWNVDKTKTKTVVTNYN